MHDGIAVTATRTMMMYEIRFFIDLSIYYKCGCGQLLLFGYDVFARQVEGVVHYESEDDEESDAANEECVGLKVEKHVDVAVEQCEQSAHHQCLFLGFQHTD